MATEALRTQLDELKWEANRLEAENRRLREENPEQSRVVTLEAELEQSKDEAAQLRDRISECERQTEAARTEAANKDDLEEQLEEERQTTNGLREALTRSEGRESELTEALEEKGAELVQLRVEEGRREEARELQYYRSLEAEREKWEVREKRMLDEVERLRDNTMSVEYVALSKKLEESHQQQQRLQKAVSERESMVSSLEGQLEECSAENQELKAELDLLQRKVRRLERSTSESAEKDSLDSTPPSSRLDACAPAFRPTVHFSLSEETTPQTTGISESLSRGEATTTTLFASVPTPRPLPSLGVGGATQTTPSALMTTSIRTASTSPNMSVTIPSGEAHPSSTVMAGAYSAAGTTAVSSSATPAVSQAVQTTTLSVAPSTTTTPTQLSGTASLYPVVHPSHLPQIPNFHGGDQRDGETFEDWLDHFEAVATIARWDLNFKLVHLTAALRGNAKSFYRSCALAQKHSYPQLVNALKKRFTPVKLTALQTRMFHSRKQGAAESVDDFAQELRKLHSKAYSTAVSGNSEAEKVGQIVLVNQFVSGLRSELQAKVVGVEGSMDEIVTKARFEEAKLKELSGWSNGPQQRRTSQPPRTQPGGHSSRPGQVRTQPTSSTPPPPANQAEHARDRRGKRNVTCFQCGMEGHIRSNCPYPKPQKESESRGRPQMKNITTQRSSNTPSTEKQKEIQELRERLRQAELDEAIESSRVVNLVVPAESEPRLGPTVYTPITVGGVTTDALVDTGSPATIVSLEFALKVLQHCRPKEQNDAQWIQLTREKFKDPDVTLKNYGGHLLDFIAQIELTLSRGGRKLTSTVLVRKDAPNDLLVGTDVQPELGLSVVTKDDDGGVTDLFTNGRIMPSRTACDQKTSQKKPETNLVCIPETNSVTVLDDGDSRPLVEHEVRLLQAVKVPAGQQKLVRATIGTKPLKGPLVFTPLDFGGDLKMVDSVVDMKDDLFVTLLLQNHTHEKQHLKKGMQLGLASPATLLTGPDQNEEIQWEPDPNPDVSRLQHLAEDSTSREKNDQGRIAELFSQLDSDFGHLTETERGSLEILLTSYADVFALEPGELGTTQLVAHSINTGQHQPIKQQVRRTPFALRKKIEELVEEMLEQEVIEPSESPWASPIVLVKKKDGDVRFCVDYRRLNQMTKLDEFPLPRVDDTLDILNGSCYFSTLDLASGYWQVAMDPESKEKTAFATFAGLYQFRKMPFGLVNAPATFQRLMEVVLSGLARRVCVVYLDDVLVFGRTIEEHNANLAQVLERLRRAGLRLKPKKCHFALTEVEYLGHVVSAKGVRTDPKKIEAVGKFPTPQDVKALRSFLGLASYYRKFVPDFAKVAGPLHALTKKDVPFLWTEKCQEAFCELKRLLTESPLLVYPDFTKPFVLETDASGAGLGAVLAQKRGDGSTRPIAYASRSLQPHEKNYGITELEGLGVVWAVKHFRPYLYGHSCEVYTDHSALTSLLNTPQPSGKLARWGMAIQELDLKIRHRSGRSNSNADALSRVPLPLGEDLPAGETDGVIAALEPGEDFNHGDLPTQQREDPDLADVIKYLATGILPQDEGKARTLVLSSSQYALEDDVLYKVEPDSTLRVVPPESQRESLFRDAHAGVFGAHLSDVKVHSELRRHYWWKGMRGDITRWTRGCLVCQSHSPGRAVHAPLTPISVNGPFDRVGVDVIQFPRSYLGNQYAVVFMDYLTKWPEVYPTPDQSATTIANLLVREIVSRHGVPSELLSDRGQAFLSGLLKEVEQLLGYKKVNTSAYHPQTDGLVKRFNRTLTAMLAKTVERGGKDWDQRLPFVLFAYRASQQQSTLESPFFLLYGRDPRLPTDLVMCPEKTRKAVNLKEYGAELASQMAEAWELARQCIRKAQKRQKDVYDRKVRPPNFKVGDRVFLFKPADKTGPLRKFARPYHGPFRVVEMDVNTAKIRRVDRPEDDAILVAVDRLRHCPSEVPDAFWPPAKQKGGKTKKTQAGDTTPIDLNTNTETGATETITTYQDAAQPTVLTEKKREGKWARRLRQNPKKRSLEDD